VEKICEKWQQESAPKVEKGGRQTPSQTRKGLERLILTFEKEKYLPKKRKKVGGEKRGGNWRRENNTKWSKNGASWKK
jgi:hypothetical protein